MRYRAAVFSSVVFAVALVARGQATQPSPLSGDPSTPKGALKSLAIALDAGDRDRIRGLMCATSAMEQKMVDATSEMAVAIADWKHAMISKFGEAPALNALADSPEALQTNLARIDSAEQKVDGDLAMVSLPLTPRESMTLVKTGDVWKISIAQQVKDEGLTPQQVDEKMAMVSSQSKMLREMSAEVASGKYSTASDAAAALRGKMSEGHDTTAPAGQ